MRLEIINTFLEEADDDLKKKIVSSLDMSQFSREELLALVRRTPELFFKGIYGLDIFKDRIYHDYHDKDEYGDDVFFFPLHSEKLYLVLLNKDFIW